MAKIKSKSQIAKDSNKFNLKDAEQVRNTVTLKNQKLILNQYKELYKQVKKEANNIKGNNITNIMRMEYLNRLQREINSEINKIRLSINNAITSGMDETSNAVVEDYRRFLYQMGFSRIDVNKSFLHLADDVVRNITTGNVYQDGWKLSDALWKDGQQIRNDINKIISNGVAMNKGSYDIAKDLEKYVNPEAMKPWDWSKVYPGVRKKIDYNAQRLARTLVSHAYQQSFMNACEKNPFITAYRWITADIHGRTCELCRSRANDDNYGLGSGVFPKNQLPLDHPNGLCTFEAVIPDSMETIADRIVDWYNSPTGTYPAIDEFADILLG